MKKKKVPTTSQASTHWMTIILNQRTKQVIKKFWRAGSHHPRWTSTVINQLRLLLILRRSWSSHSPQKISAATNSEVRLLKKGNLMRTGLKDGRIKRRVLPTLSSTAIVNLTELKIVLWNPGGTKVNTKRSSTTIGNKKDNSIQICDLLLHYPTKITFHMSLIYKI